MTSHTLWEEGRAPAHEMVALGVAVLLTASAVELLVGAAVIGWLFDLAFVALALALALLVRPRDFFTVGVLPPLLMVGVFAMLGATRPSALADPGDGVVQVVVTGLADHSLALVVGYALCLLALAARNQVRRTGAPLPGWATAWLEQRAAGPGGRGDLRRSGPGPRHPAG